MSLLVPFLTPSFSFLYNSFAWIVSSFIIQHQSTAASIFRIKWSFGTRSSILNQKSPAFTGLFLQTVPPRFLRRFFFKNWGKCIDKSVELWYNYCVMWKRVFISLIVHMNFFDFEAWLSLVERCVREHRTVGVHRRAVCCIFPLTLHCYGVFGNLKSRSKILLTTCLTTSVGNPYFEAWLSLVERCVREHRTVGARRRAVYGTLPLTLHCYGDFVGRWSWSKISLTTYLTTFTKFGVKKSIIEAWLSLVERCVREHRTVGARYRAVCGILPLTLHRYSDFVGRKSWSEISLTTCLTTYTKFGVKNSIIETWLSLVERCVRDAEVACSNHVVSTTQTALSSHFRLAERFNFFICRNILLHSSWVPKR